MTVASPARVLSTAISPRASVRRVGGATAASGRAVPGGTNARTGSVERPRRAEQAEREIFDPRADRDPLEAAGHDLGHEDRPIRRRGHAERAEPRGQRRPTVARAERRAPAEPGEQRAVGCEHVERAARAEQRPVRQRREAERGDLVGAGDGAQRRAGRREHEARLAAAVLDGDHSSPEGAAASACASVSRGRATRATAPPGATRYTRVCRDVNASPPPGKATSEAISSFPLQRGTDERASRTTSQPDRSARSRLTSPSVAA